MPTIAAIGNGAFSSSCPMGVGFDVGVPDGDADLRAVVSVSEAGMHDVSALSATKKRGDANTSATVAGFSNVAVTT